MAVRGRTCGKPWRERFNRGHVAHIHWSDGTLDWFSSKLLDAEMERLAVPVLRALYDQYVGMLPRKSELHTGGSSGGWMYCPRDLADQVERIVSDAQRKVMDSRPSEWMRPENRGSFPALRQYG